LKELKEIVTKITCREIMGPLNVPINAVVFDSRKSGKKDLFVAVKGTQVDGHEYIDQAISRGVKAVVCESLPPSLQQGVTYIRVENSNRALGILASGFYDDPSGKLVVVGVTGTNGKTTIATLLYEVFTRLGYTCGLLSTIRNMIGDEAILSTHTTPDAVQISELLCRMVKKGCKYCFMEVSSHSIDQERISGIRFRGGIFTNITHEHLDYHKTFGEYLKVKKRFFDSLTSDAFALTNADDRSGDVMLQNCVALKKKYSLKKMADFKGRIIESSFDGMCLEINGGEIWTRLIGGFNASNLLAVYAAAMLLGENSEDVMTGLSLAQPVEGRFNYIRSKNNITGIVDYAHTPDALENVLETINSIRDHTARLITVVGAGGDRDRSKRPLMAKVTATACDQVILTSDNPRSEDPEMIIEEMKKGLDSLDEGKVMTVVNRKEAIKTACRFARPGDIILVAGKGHEKYQEIKGVKSPFDDMKILEEYLNSTI
jgi:UDP-N-acetylmuramoyl-L-alanyl-D-glutamate--2,6-diaminopimelate ligase